jgi:hypothetical protein
MKKLFMPRLAAAFAALCFAAPAYAQFTTVSASQTGGTGHLVANATIYWQPMSSPTGPAGAARIGSSGGQIQGVPYQATVTAGVFSLSIPDALATNPTICYAVTAIDNATGWKLLGAGLT